MEALAVNSRTDSDEDAQELPLSQGDVRVRLDTNFCRHLLVGANSHAGMAELHPLRYVRDGVKGQGGSPCARPLPQPVTFAGPGPEAGRVFSTRGCAQVLTSAVSQRLERCVHSSTPSSRLLTARSLTFVQCCGACTVPGAAATKRLVVGRRERTRGRGSFDETVAL